jgi:hypothetical protein
MNYGILNLESTLTTNGNKNRVQHLVKLISDQPIVCYGDQIIKASKKA